MIYCPGMDRIDVGTFRLRKIVQGHIRDLFGGTDLPLKRQHTEQEILCA